MRITLSSVMQRHFIVDFGLHHWAVTNAVHHFNVPSQNAYFCMYNEQYCFKLGQQMSRLLRGHKIYPESKERDI